MKNRKDNRKSIYKICHTGFSLMEVIISVFVISVGIVSIFPLIGQSLATSLDSRDQIIASFLAQEGVEIIQSIRDNNWADGTTGDAAFTTNMPGSDYNNCVLNYTSTALNSGNCNKGFSSTALFRDSSGFYVLSGSTATKFHRKLQLDYSGSGENMTVEVTSMVVWGGSNFPSVANCVTSNKCAYAKTMLTQWFE